MNANFDSIRCYTDSEIAEVLLRLTEEKQFMNVLSTPCSRGLVVHVLPLLARNSDSVPIQTLLAQVWKPAPAGEFNIGNKCKRQKHR